MADRVSDYFSQALRGDSEALEQLLLAHYAELSARLTPRIPDRMRSHLSVEDVLQEAFVQVFRDFGQFRNLTEGPDCVAFRAWIGKIAEHRLTDMIRKADRVKRGGRLVRVGHDAALRSSLGELLNELQMPGDSPSFIAGRQEAIDAMQVALGSLPEDQRQALELHFLQHESLEVTAERMGRTVSSVRSLIHRAKQALRQHLHESILWLSHRNRGTS